MADSWDDDDYEPQLPVVNAPTTWEDEEEEEEEETVVASRQAPVLSEASKKKAALRALNEKQAKLDALMDENETAEDRKLRERRVVEEGDNELTNELFGGGDKPSALDPEAMVIKLKDLKDHLALVVTLNEKMASSKRNHVVAFAKEFLKSNEDKFEATDLSDFITVLTNQRDAKLKEKRQPTASKKEVKSKKMSKKEQLEAQKKHEEAFGKATGGDKYDNYDDQYDDYMF